MITFNDLRPGIELSKDISVAFTRVMLSGRYIGGEEVEKFEAEFADYVGSKHCIAVGNGFDALQISLKAWGLGPGSRIAVPTNTCVPTWAAINNVGATAVPIDPSEHLVIGTKSFTNHNKIDAVIPVHLYGNPVDKEYIEELCGDYIVIEDACQGHGSYSHGSHVGTIGDMGCFSFYPTKNLGCYGDGGAIVTNDEALAREARQLRRYDKPGAINSCLDPLQAAFLRARLPLLEEENERRRDMAMLYRIQLEGTPRLGLPEYRHNQICNYHQYVVLAWLRDELQKWLTVNHIETMVHYRTPPHETAISKRLSDHVLSLPIANVSMQQIQYISDKIKEFYGYHDPDR